MSQAYWLGGLPGHLPTPAAGATDWLRMSGAGSPMGGRHDGDQALSKPGWAGASPKAYNFPPRTRRSGAGPQSGTSKRWP